MYRLTIEPLSYVLIGSGYGYGALIDSDVVFDGYGIPYLPAKRIKGLLRESAIEICEMTLDFDEKNILSLFGDSTNSGLIKISNFFITDYPQIMQWLRWAFNGEKSNIKKLVNQQSVLNTFTELRQSTAIEEDKGVAKEGSLRTVRVLKPNEALKFHGTIEKLNDNKDETLLTYACLNLKRMGTKRNRGFGRIACTLWQDSNNLTAEIIKQPNERD